MFHFPGCPSHRLWIHLWMTAHYHGRVSPFGYPGITAYLQLPRAFRSLSRPSSAISALASTLRSYSLDLASFASVTLLRLLRGDFRSFVSFRSPCAVFKVQAGCARFHLLPRVLSRRIGHRTASRRRNARQLLDFEVSCEPSKRYRDDSVRTLPPRFRSASAIISVLRLSPAVLPVSPASFALLLSASFSGYSYSLLPSSYSLSRVRPGI